jgi:hypothetical protein
MMTIKKRGRGRPSTGQGPRIYIPLPKVKAVKMLKRIPNEKIPVVEEMLQALVDQANMKNSENS